MANPQNLISPVEKGGPARPGAGRKKGSPNGLRAQVRAILRKHPNVNVIEVLKLKGIDLKTIDRFRQKEVVAGVADVLAAEALAGNMTAIQTMFAQTQKPLGKQGGINPPIYLLPSPEEARAIMDRLGGRLIEDQERLIEEQTITDV